MPQVATYVPGARFRVTESFPPDFFDGLSEPPLVVKSGDRVVVLPEPGSGTWPAFVLVRNDRGELGWVPRRLLEPAGDRAVVTERYDTATLVPRPGEVLELLYPDLEAGWLWCRDAHGRAGWFPVNRLVSTEETEREQSH